METIKKPQRTKLDEIGFLKGLEIEKATAVIKYCINDTKYTAYK
jgi:hypothetical protein